MSKRSTIRFHATRYPHWGQYAGIGQFTRHLDADQFRVDYHLANDDDSGLPLPGKARRARVRERVQRSGMAWYKLSDLAAEMRAFAACAFGRADIVHFLDGEHGVQFLPGWLDRWAMDDIPVVASYHQPPDLLPDLVDPRVVAQLDAVVLVSPSQEAFFNDLLPPDKVVTILHGIDTDFFRPVAAPAPRPFRCITAGHWLRDWQAIKAAAESLRSDPSIEFHVVTGGDTGLQGLPNVVQHSGLSDAELVALYQSCHLGFLPLIDSTANNSLLEMIACGLPLLSTDILSVRAYAGDMRGVILLPPGERHGHADVVRQLAGDEGRRLMLAKGARERALELSWRHIAPHYGALYTRLLQEKRGGRAALAHPGREGRTQ